MFHVKQSDVVKAPDVSRETSEEWPDGGLCFT